MKFSCYKNDLIEALQIVIRAVAVKSQTPILSGIYLKADGSILEIQSNNYSIGIIVKIPVNTEIDGEVVVSGKRFQEFVRNMPDDMITFSSNTDNNIFSISSGGANVELLTMSADEFPKVKTPDTDSSFKISIKVLKDLIRKTIYAVSRDDSRPVFTGCYFEINGKILSLVATNTHRIAIAKGNLDDSYDKRSFIVPADTLRGIMQKISSMNREDYVNINYSVRNVTFTFDNIYMTSRLIEGEFPDYNRVIPAESSTYVETDTEEFKKAVEFVALMSRETEYNTVKFDFSSGCILISSNSLEVGGAEKSVEAAVDGNTLEIHFNVDYISDVLKVIDSERIKIALNNELSPAMFTEIDDNNFIYVVTPVRVQ